MAFDFGSFEQKAQAALTHLVQDLGQLRTGGASPQMLDMVNVEAYGTQMKITELANVSVPDPTMIVISPWDKSLLGTIEKGIAIAPLNLHPIVDGQIIRISVPPLTEERRKEMVKVLKQKIEGGRVMLRTIRGDFRKEIEKQQNQPGVSEDMVKAWLADLDERVKVLMDKVSQLEQDKEKDLLKV